MLSDGAVGKVPECAAGHPVPRPAGALREASAGTVRGVARDGGSEPENVRHTAQYEAVSEVSEAVHVFAHEAHVVELGGLEICQWEARILVYEQRVASGQRL